MLVFSYLEGWLLELFSPVQVKLHGSFSQTGQRLAGR